MSYYFPTQKEIEESGYKVIHFPAEAKYATFNKDMELLTDFYDSEYAAMVAAFNRESR